MVLVSVCLHAAGILAIVAVSFTISRPTKPLAPVITPVTVVSEPIGPPVLDTVAPGPVEAPPEIPVHEVLEAPQLSHDDAKPPQETISMAKLSPPKREAIPLAKRKKPLKSLEAEKPPEKPKEPVKKKETVQKKEDPKDYLAQRMAAISKEVEEKANKKRASSSSSGGQAKPVGPGGPSLDEESARWISAVKSQIKSQWSLSTDWRQTKRFAEIGIQVGENGQLLNTTVDESSGDRVFDDSALRAVNQAAPFPPLSPKVKAWISQEGGLITLKFTSRGIQ
jgi:TonB family protein